MKASIGLKQDCSLAGVCCVVDVFGFLTQCGLIRAAIDLAAQGFVLFSIMSALVSVSCPEFYAA